MTDTGKQDLALLTENEFKAKYGATKALYDCVIKSLDILGELKELLTAEQGHLGLDIDVIDGVEATSLDIEELLERMHSVSYWADAQEDD